MTINDTTSNHALDALERASEGLLFQSETDAPLTSFFWPCDEPVPLTPARLLELIQGESSTPVKTTTLATFFRRATKKEAWHNAEEKAEALKFKSLVATLKSTLQKPQVFRVGEVRIDVYIVGAVEVGYAGLQTWIVET